MIIRYRQPVRWLAYDVNRIIGPLTEAKAAVMSLTGVPYRRAWAERLQAIQLKQEVAGTSRIEGAEFTEGELDEAIDGSGSDAELTRSQRQARAAVSTYRWIAKLEKDRPITADLIFEIHRRIVTGCDDDHCQPGALRSDGENVTFGNPRHRGAEGGKDCASAFQELCNAVSREFRDHDILVQGLALHYQIGAMHPFLDGNGRTARALEALLLQRAGLKDALFISLSNYYYDEKNAYLRSLAEVDSQQGDLTTFFVFGLKGIASQCRRLLAEINREISKTLFRDMAHELFGSLKSTKKRVIAKRQMSVLNFLLEKGARDLNSVFRELRHIYDLADPYSGFMRDIISLVQLKAVNLTAKRDGDTMKLTVDVRLSWPTEISETDFFREVQNMPKAKTFDFLQKYVAEAPDKALDDLEVVI